MGRRTCSIPRKLIDMKPLKNNPLFYKHKIVKFHTFEGEKLFEVVWYTDFGTMKQEMNFKTYKTLEGAKRYVNKRIAEAQHRFNL